MLNVYPTTRNSTQPRQSGSLSRLSLPREPGRSTVPGTVRFGRFHPGYARTPAGERRRLLDDHELDALLDLAVARFVDPLPVPTLPKGVTTHQVDAQLVARHCLPGVTQTAGYVLFAGEAECLSPPGGQR